MKSWNEIRKSARKFREFWTLAKDSEVGGYQKFWLSLLGDVLGMDDVMARISFQSAVQLKDTTKFLDAWIPETRVLIEHKSRGIKLDAPQAGHGGKTPFEQALEYNIARPFSEKARWIVTCNFLEIWVYDMNHPLEDPQKILLANLPKEISRLGFLVDTSVKTVREKEMDISIKAGRIVGELYKELLKRYGNISRGGAEARRIGEDVELCDSASPREEYLAALNRLCVRLVFCFYAEDAEIFPKDCFWKLLNETPAKFLRDRLLRLFRTLDTPEAERDPYLEPELAAFPYTNGGLFRGVSDAEVPPLDDDIKELLIKSANFDWRDISPTIFGALFESTLNPETRRSGGMVYTSVENIHKVIDPLFMNDLTAELESIKSERAIAVRRAKATAFQEKLGSLTFLDPACGSGNFLTETFLSLRKLENEAIVVGERLKPGEVLLNLDGIVKVSIKQFHGIEINDFAVSVAKTAMWISEAKMLNETANILHAPPKYLPLHDYDGIVEGNALRMDWGNLISRRDAEAQRFDYIMGNPPFIGYSNQSAAQKEDILSLYRDEKGKPYKTAGKIDYVTGWYWKAAELGGHCAFVSTNSICQGEQVASVWKPLVERFGLKIDFAHRTFRWDNESFEKAHVHCVIVGFHVVKTHAESQRRGEHIDTSLAEGASKNLRSSASPREAKTIFDSGKAIPAAHINGYLMDAQDVWIESRTKPLCDVPEMRSGGKPVEGGHLILTTQEKDDLLRQEPKAEKFLRQFMGSEDYIHNETRWCLWLKDVSPAELRSMPKVLERVQKVREFRLASVKPATRQAADTPWRFMEIKLPETDYVMVPAVSSEKRKYVPLGYLSSNVIPSNLASFIPSANLYHFGILTSSAHMAWMRVVAGRLEMRYRYSAAIVYNNFPWPSFAKATEGKPDLCDSASLREKISQTAQAILDARGKYPDSSLADLYDPLTMPPDLRAAHEANDRAVLAAYGLKPGTPELEIVAHLFKLYAEMTESAKESCQ